MAKQSKFKGDPEHLERLMRLVDSPIHSEERGQALDEWRTFNRVASSPPGASSNRKVAKWQDYQKPRGVDLRCVELPWAFLGNADLQGAQLNNANLIGARFKNARFDGATMDAARLGSSLLLGASFERASMIHADIREVDAKDATFRRANLAGADFSDSTLAGVDFSEADLTGANFSGANLTNAVLVGSNVSGAIFDDACVYGVSAWDLRGEPGSCQNLVITPEPPAITVDNLKVAQFVYLMYRNPEIREVLDTVTRKVVLILGRFTTKRKAVLDALRISLREHDFVPIVFDFDAPSDRDLTETVTLLARMARFVVADLTDPASIPQELQAIAPDVAVPIRLIIESSDRPYAMSRDLRKYPWVLKPFEYDNLDHLLVSLKDEVITPAESCRSRMADDIK